MGISVAIEHISGTIALATMILGLLPQIYKAYRTKSTKDISALWIWNYLIGSIAWLTYGTITKSKYIILSNILGIATSVILLLQKKRYDKQ